MCADDVLPPMRRVKGFNKERTTPTTGTMPPSRRLSSNLVNEDPLIFTSDDPSTFIVYARALVMGVLVQAHDCNYTARQSEFVKHTYWMGRNRKGK